MMDPEERMTDRRYETLLLLTPELGEAGAHEQVARVRALMEEQGATVNGEHEWGLRELAYPVREQRRAIFALFEFRATPAALAEIERNLRLMEPVLRFLSTQEEEGAPPAAELRPMEPRSAGFHEGGRPRERGGWDSARRGEAEGADDASGDDDDDTTEGAAESTATEERR